MKFKFKKGQEEFEMEINTIEEKMMIETLIEKKEDLLEIFNYGNKDKDNKNVLIKTILANTI